MLAPRAGVAQRHRRPSPHFTLDVHVEHVHARQFQVPLDRTDGDRPGAVEGRARERRIDEHRTRCRRRVRHRHDQVLVAVGVEVEPVAASHGSAAVAEDVPREARAWRHVLVRRVLVELSRRRLRGAQIRKRRVAAVDILRHRRELVAQSAVQRQPRRDLIVVLRVETEEREPPVAIELRVGRESDEARRRRAQKG